MKTILAFALLLSVVHGSVGQEFTGEVTYRRTIIPKNSSLDANEILSDDFGDSFLYTIAGPFYKCVMSRRDTMVSQYSYHHADFRFYQQRKPGYIAYTDSRDTSTSVTFTVYKDSVKTIAGYQCFMIEKKYPTYTMKSYYSPEVRVNPQTFKGHGAAAWDKELEASNGSFHLMSISEFADYTEVYEAVKVERKPIDVATFTIHTNKLLVPSYNALDQQPTIAPMTRSAYKCYKEKLSEAKFAPGTEADKRCMMLMVIDRDGNMKHLHPYKKDKSGIYKITTDLLTHCGISFQPGTIGGKAVEAEYVFMIDFNN